MVNRLFGIDCRALAFFRINLALIFIVDLVRRSEDLTAHYSDVGVLPRQVAGDLFQYKGLWSSLHYLGGSAVFEATLFLLAGLFAFSLLVGYRTRTATLICWLFLLSLHDRNTMILYGGDIVLKVLFFWALFLPLGVCWSVDRILNDKFEPPKQILTMATIALLAQVCLIYWTGLYFKWKGGWMDGTAIHYALNINQFATPLGIWLREYQNILPAMNYLVYFGEGLGPLLVFSPLGTGPIRTFAALSMMLMHICFGFCLELGLFPWMSISCWIPFLPIWFWDRMPKISLYPFFCWCRAYLKPQPIKIQTSRIENIGVGLLLVTVIFLNFWGMHPKPANLPRWTHYWSRLGSILHMHQRWNMFSRPLRDDGWYVVEGTLLNGDKVDLFNRGKKVDWRQPFLVSNTYANDRWRKYMMNLWWEQHMDHRKHYARYIAWEWNQRHQGLRQIASIDLYYVLNRTPLPPKTKRSTKRVLLWSETFTAY